jgi:hypothetical protein
LLCTPLTSGNEFSHTMTSTLPPEGTIGQPFAIAVASSIESALTIV